MAVRRFRDIKIVYTRDNGSDRILAQRVYVNTSDGNARTPITPLLLARQDNQPWVLEPMEKTYRNVESCFVVNGEESKFRVFIPYNPNDPNLGAHIKEIRDYPGVQLVTYRGENRIVK